MPAHGTQVRVWVSRRRAWVTAGDHRAARRATPGRCPRGASPRGQAPRMLRLWLSRLVACRTARAPSSWSATASPPLVPQDHLEPARPVCPLCIAASARGLARAGSDGTGAGPGHGTRQAACTRAGVRDTCEPSGGSVWTDTDVTQQ